MQRLNLKLLSGYDRSKYQQHLFYRKDKNEDKIHITVFDGKSRDVFDVATIELSEENKNPELYTIDYILSDLLKMEYSLLRELVRDTLEVSHLEWYGDRGSGYAHLKEFIYYVLGYDINNTKEI